LYFFAQEVADTNPHLVEGRLCQVLGLEAELLELEYARETWGIGLDHKEADPAPTRTGVTLHGQDDQVGLSPVRDERLRVVHHVAFPVANGSLAHRLEV
jgi:hypothetical protein